MRSRITPHAKTATFVQDATPLPSVVQRDVLLCKTVPLCKAGDTLFYRGNPDKSYPSWNGEAGPDSVYPGLDTGTELRALSQSWALDAGL